MNSFWSYLNPSFELIGRLTLALVAGGAIGWNRRSVGQVAGLRTYMLVSLSAALFVMTLLVNNPSPSSNAVSRITQGIATGIGFVGAGMIVQQVPETGDHQPIEGLTSAAGIWVVAPLGILAACGLWQLTLIGTLFTLLILHGGLWLERFIHSQREE